MAPLSDGTLTATDLAETIIGGQGTVSNATFTGAASAAGTFLGGVQAVGVDSGVILSSGAATSVVGPNVLDDISTDHGLPGDGSLNTLVPGGGTLDAAVLEFDVVPDSFELRFDFVFASDEYNEYANTGYNDVFGFFIDGVNIAQLPDGSTNVTVNTINGGNPLGTNAHNPEFYTSNDLSDGGPFFDTEMDGFTVVLNAVAFLPIQTHHVKLAIADVGDHIYDSNVFITTLGCLNEDLSEVAEQPAGRVSVRYDAEHLWPKADPDYLVKAALMAQAVKDRAESSVTEYSGLGFSVPSEVTVEARCAPAFFNVAPSDRDAVTDHDGTVKLKADFLRRTMTPYVKAVLGGETLPVGGTEWADLIDHELGHVIQLHEIGLGSQLMFAAFSPANIEGTAVLGQDLLPDTDDSGATSWRSFTNTASAFLDQLGPVDPFPGNGVAEYQAAAFYQYLAERFGDEGASTLEHRAADMSRRLYTGPTSLGGVRDAIGADKVSEVIDALRDFYVTGYVRLAPNKSSLPPWLRILDETTAHGAAPGTGPTPPDWGTIDRTLTDTLTASTSVQLAGALERTRGVIYEVPLEAGLSEVRVTVADETGFAICVPEPCVDPEALRLGIVPVSSGEVVIDPAFLGVGPSRSRSLSFDVPVVDMDTLAIAVVAGPGGRTYRLTVEARAGTAALNLDPIPDVAYDEQAAGIVVYAHPSVNGVPSRGLPKAAFSATVDGAPATVSSAFDNGSAEVLVVRTATTLDPGPHSVQLFYGSATASGNVQITDVGESPLMAGQSVSGSLRSMLWLGGLGEAGTPIEVRFAVTDGGSGLPGATVAATVTDPAEVVRTFPLADSGGELDSGYGDGAYGAPLFGTDLEGTYTITVNASGLDGAGTPFAIQDSDTITLGPKVDADGDGVADSVEPWFGLDPADPADGAADPDFDGASTATELAAGSDPLDPDTDAGGEADGSELGAARSPTSPSDDATLPDTAIAAAPRDGRMIHVTVAARDGATPIRVYRSSNLGLVDLGLHPGAGEAFEDGPLPAGQYAYLAIAEPTSGVRSAPVSTGLVDAGEDVTPPVARILLNGDRPATNDVTLVVQFTDLAEPVTAMRLAETPEALASASWLTYQSPTTFTIGPAEGFHELYAQVRDAAGNISAPAQAIVELDITSPTSVAGPIDPQYATATVDVPFTASDDLSGVATVELWSRYRPTQSDPWSPWVVGPTSLASPMTYTFGADGFYEFYTIGVDVAGNREAAPSAADAVTEHVVGDSTPPVSVAGPLDATYTTSSIAVPYTASDDASGVSVVELWARHRPNEAQLWSPWALAATVTSSPISYTFAIGDGNYEFYTIAIDGADNREAAPATADAATRRDAADDPPDYAWEYLYARRPAPDVSPPPCEPFCALEAGDQVTLVGRATVADDRGVVSVRWRLYQVYEYGGGESRSLVRNWSAAVPVDGAFDTRIEDFFVSDSRPPEEVFGSYYDVEIEVKVGNKVKLVRTDRVPIVWT